MCRMAVRSGFVCMLLTFFLLCAHNFFEPLILSEMCCLHNCNKCARMQAWASC